MAVKIYKRTGITGGTSADMDEIDGNDLNDGDFCFVMTAPTSNKFYAYSLDADSGVTESIPKVIAPDTNPGNKRWIFQGEYNNSIPDSPKSVGSISGVTELLEDARAVAVQGNYAYVCGYTSDSLVIIELNQYSQALAEIGGLLVNNLVCRGHSELEHLDVKNNAGVGGNLLVKGKISTSGDKIAIRTTKTPAASAAAGKKGDICWDASYIYMHSRWDLGAGRNCYVVRLQLGKIYAKH